MSADGRPTGVSQDQKTKFCGKAISKLIFEKRVDATHFAYLRGISEAILAKNPENAEAVEKFVVPNLSRGWMAAFEVK